MVFALELAALSAGCLADFGGVPPAQQGGPGSPPSPPPAPPPPPPGPTVATIVITRSGPDTLASFDDRQHFTAEARDASGARIPGKVFTWTLDATTVVTLDQGSVTVTAADNGVARLHASVDGISAEIPVVVWQQVASISVEPRSKRVDIFKSATLVATARDASDHTVTRPLAYQWSADKEYALLIEPDAQNSGRATVTRVVSGTTNVTATVDGKSASASIR